MTLGFKTMLAGFLMVAISFPSSSQAQSLSALFEDAQSLCAKKDYDGCVSKYETLVDNGIVDADLHYNLGLAYGHQKKYGLAIYNFEQSLHIEPRQSDADQALRVSRDALAKSRAQSEGEVVIQTAPMLESMVRPFTSNNLTWATLIFNALLFVLLIAAMYLRDRARWMARITAAACAIMVALCGLGLCVKTGVFRRGDVAIVTQDKEILRAAPDQRADEIGVAREGERGYISDTNEKFSRVHLSSGRQGWILSSSVGRIGRSSQDKD